MSEAQDAQCPDCRSCFVFGPDHGVFYDCGACGATWVTAAEGEIPGQLELPEELWRSGDLNASRQLEPGAA